jgi:hypothetical protein
MHVSRRTLIATAVGLPAAAAATVMAMQSRGAMPPPEVEIGTSEGLWVIVSNGVPDHPVGDFPNRHDPVPLRTQRHRFQVPLEPRVAERPVDLGFWNFGVAVNGVPFDPSGPYWNADATSGYRFEVMAPLCAVALGIDVNRAHTQGRGTYHYHGMPTGLLWALRAREPGRPMQLLGYAADGFPIYGPEGPGDPQDLGSTPRRLRSSYRLRDGKRPDGPGGRYDGTFVEDHVFEPGSGDLDECNGRTGPTPEYPDGIYHYVLTDEFPFIPRLYRGTPDPSFRHGPPPGVSPPLPSELLRYRTA